MRERIQSEVTATLIALILINIVLNLNEIQLEKHHEDKLGPNLPVLMV